MEDLDSSPGFETQVESGDSPDPEEKRPDSTEEDSTPTQELLVEEVRLIPDDSHKEEVSQNESQGSGKKEVSQNGSQGSRDRGGKRAKTEKKLSPPPNPGVFNKRPHENSVRGGKPYISAEPFSPRSNYLTYIRQLEEILREDDFINLHQERKDQHITKVFRQYGWDSPRVDPEYLTKNKRYQEAARAFFEIKRILTRQGARQHPEFEYYLACLEMVGVVIINNSSLSNVEYSYNDYGRIAYLRSCMCATEWTQERIEKIQWNSDGEISFHKILRGKVYFNSIRE